MEAYAGKLTDNSLSGLSGPMFSASQMMAEPPQPPISKLFNAMDMMRKACALAGETTDRLCGSQPTSGEKESAGLSGGTFSEIEFAALQFQRMAEQIISDMGRISSRL